MSVYRDGDFIGASIKHLVVSGRDAAAFVVGYDTSQTLPTSTRAPAMVVDTSLATGVTGLKIKSQAVGTGVSLSAISPAANEALVLSGKGSGGVTIGGPSDVVTLAKTAISSHTVTTRSDAGAITIAVSDIVGGYVTCPVGTAATWTLPTLVLLKAATAMPTLAAGSWVDFAVENTGSALITLGASADITIPTAITVAAGTVAVIRIIVRQSGTAASAYRVTG